MTPDADPGDPPTLPPGTFRIDRDGAWRHEGLEVTHPGVLQNLYANLRAERDLHHLQVGPRLIPVDVDDAPFVVVRIEAAPGGAGEGLTAHLTDGSVEPFAAATLALGLRGTPYCRVKGGRFRARLSVPAWLQLAPFLEDGPDAGTVTLAVGGRRHVIDSHS